jgi:hypothetical protein
MNPMQEPSGHRTSIVGRVYVLRKNATPACVAPHAWPGPGWEQLGPIAVGELIAPADGQLLVMIDTDTSSPTAPLRATLPPHVDSLHFHGRTGVSLAWMHELPDLAPRSVAFDAPPAAERLAAIVDCAATLETLALGRTGIPGMLAVSSLGFLDQLPRLRRLHLHNIDPRGTLDSAALPVEHLVVQVDYGPNPRTWPWHGFGWVVRFPELQSLSVDAPELDTTSLEHLASLSRLHSLTLRSCPVSADVLRSWRHLSRVQELDLSRAHVRKGALRAIPALSGLRSLSIASVLLASEEMNALGSLPALERLKVDSGTVGGPIGVLANGSLKRLNLAFCNLERDALAGLERLATLEALDLSDTSVDESMISGAFALPVLEELSLAGCEDVTLQHAIVRGSLPTLKLLDISESGVGTPVLNQLADLPRLEVLRATDLPPNAPLDVTAFAPSLRALHLDRNALASSTMRAIAGCSALNILSLERCSAEPVALAALATLTGLRSFKFTPATEVPDWLADFSLLEELAVEGASLSRRDFERIAHLPSLVRLQLPRCRLEAGSGGAFAAFRALEALELGECDIRGTGVLNALPLTLRYLNLAKSNPDDEEMSMLHSASLERLVLYEAPITAAGLLAMGDTPRLDALFGVPPPRNEQEREQIVARFPACWTLLDQLSGRAS